MRTKIFIVSLLLVFSLVNGSRAQQYPSRHFTTLDGLPNNAIRSLFLDSRGLLWIGTENGISKMENNVFQNFDESDGLAFNSCWAITEDPLGQMWFGSYGGGLSMFDGQFFHAFTTGDGMIDDHIRKLFYFEGRIWVGTRNGISAIDIRSKEIISLKGSILPSPQAYVSSFFVYEGVLHYTTYAEGVYRVVPDSAHSFLIKKVNDHKLIYYSKIRGDSLLLSNQGSVQPMKMEALTAGMEVKKGFGQSIVWDYCKDNQGNLYAAARGLFNKDGGLYQVEGNRMCDRSEAFGVDSKMILAIAYDPQRNVLYAGSHDQGLYAVTLSKSIMYEHFGGKSVLGFGHIAQTTAVLHDQGLSLLDTAGIETLEVGLNDFKQVEATYVQKNANRLPLHKGGFFELDFGLAAADLEFYEIIQTDSSFWVSSNLGIYELDTAGEFLSYLPVHTYVMGLTPDGRFIDSNPYHGVRIYQDPAEMLYRYYSDSLSSTPIQLSQMVTSPHKTYFSSVFHGLYEWKDGKFLNYPEQKIWSEEKIKAIHLIDEFLLAIGSEFGDFFIAEDRDGFKIKETISKNKIEGNSVQFLESWNGNLLIGTEKGLTVYNKGNIRFFDEEQGFKSKLFESAKVMGDVLWLGTHVGYYKVSLPGLLGQKDLPLELKITQVEVNHSPVPPSEFSWFSFQEKGIEVPHHQNTIYLSFKPTGHRFPDKLQYRYRLKSGDTWSPISKETTLSLPYLPAGVFPVEIEVTDRHTGISRIIPLLTITVNSAFYQQAGFWIILFGGFLAVAGWGYKARIRNLHKKEKEKRIIVRRLAETKLEALRSQMNPHFIFNAINSIQYFILKNDTDGAMDYLMKFSNLIRSTLDNSSRLQISLNEEINYLEAYFAIENSRMDNRVKLLIGIDPNLNQKKVMVPPMLFQPFVENAFIHAFTNSHKSPRILIEFKLGKEQLHCTISDNGTGQQGQSITKTHKSKGKDLVLERLRLLEGVVNDPLEIRHSPSGTVVRVTIPLMETDNQ